MIVVVSHTCWVCQEHSILLALTPLISKQPKEAGMMFTPIFSKTEREVARDLVLTTRQGRSGQRSGGSSDHQSPGFGNVSLDPESATSHTRDLEEIISYL